MSETTPANISIVTLGVADLDHATTFYKALGWRDTTASQEGVRFLQGECIVVGLYPRDKLAEDVATPDTAKGFSGITLAINLDDEATVDGFFDRAIAAGAHPQKRPEKAFWGGYSGYFADADGHLWEVAYNPFFERDPATAQVSLETLTDGTDGDDA